MEALGEEIKKFGLDNYKNILDNYNNAIETIRAKGNLPTPQQIVDAEKDNQPIDLIPMINAEIEHVQEQ